MDAIKPILKWVGGKRRHLKTIRALLPEGVEHMTYYEPFCGGAAVLFDLLPKKAFVSDINPELINFYKAVRDEPEELIRLLESFVDCKENYNQLRNLDRQVGFNDLSTVFRAYRFYVLVTRAFCGKFEINSKGCFSNTYSNPKRRRWITHAPEIRTASEYFNTSNVYITCADYEEALAGADDNSFVFLDPPYHPVSPKGNYTSYYGKKWTEDTQRQLGDYCKDLDRRGVKFLLTNSSTPLTKEIYKDFKLTEVPTTHHVNAYSANRRRLDLFAKNY